MDTFNVVRDTLHATFEIDDNTPLDISRPTTPLPDRPRTLRRTISYASIDTVRPPTPKKRGVRRRIEDIADNLKHKSAKKKKKHASAQDVPENETHDVASNTKASAESKAAKRGRTAASPLRDASHRSEEESVLAIADRLHSGVPFELDPPLTFTGYKTHPPIDVPLFKEDEEVWENRGLPIRTLRLGPHVTTECQDTTQSPPIAKIDTKNVQLSIRPSETNMTIWDGLGTAHHVFKCRLVLRCTACPHDNVSLPDINCIEMDCTTRPIGSRYARPATLQAAYEGAEPGQVAEPDGLPNVKLEAGIHMDKAWCKFQDDDGTWGWYRDAFVPLSSRLFDKVEYREFKLVGRVWTGEGCVEDELTFGISMLLRAVDMK